jgi:hypothetical protein
MQGSFPAGVRRVFEGYPGEYWRGLDAKSAYPTAPHDRF